MTETTTLDICKNWLAAKAKENEARASRLHFEKELLLHAEHEDDKRIRLKAHDFDGTVFDVTIEGGVTRSIDADEMTKILKEHPELRHSIKIDYKVREGHFKKLDGERKKILQRAITTKFRKPYVKIQGDKK